MPGLIYNTLKAKIEMEHNNPKDLLWQIAYETLYNYTKTKLAEEDKKTSYESKFQALESNLESEKKEDQSANNITYTTIQSKFDELFEKAINDYNNDAINFNININRAALLSGISATLMTILAVAYGADAETSCALSVVAIILILAVLALLYMGKEPLVSYTTEAPQLKAPTEPAAPSSEGRGLEKFIASLRSAFFRPAQPGGDNPTTAPYLPEPSFWMG